MVSRFSVPTPEVNFWIAASQTGHAREEFPSVTGL
jgi:hypothetical protein